jgi:hypothetical protein
MLAYLRRVDTSGRYCCRDLPRLCQWLAAAGYRHSNTFGLDELGRFVHSHYHEFEGHQANICSHIQIMRDGVIYAFDVDAIHLLDSLIVEASIEDDALAVDYCESASLFVSP